MARNHGGSDGVERCAGSGQSGTRDRIIGVLVSKLRVSSRQTRPPQELPFAFGRGLESDLGRRRPSYPRLGRQVKVLIAPPGTVVVNARRPSRTLKVIGAQNPL